MAKFLIKTMYYINRAIFGIQTLFYVLLGARGCGKTYSTMNYCLRKFFKKGEKFLWLRLTESSVKNLLQCDAKDFIDSKLQEKWNITSMSVSGNAVFINGKEACRVMALSTFYAMKGVALNKASGTVKKTSKAVDDPVIKGQITKTVKKFRTIVLDEMNREKNEKRTFDICYAFVNQLENICRFDTDRRIILLGNTLDEASDILAGCFNFIPNRFGVFKLKRKKCVIHYIEDSEEYQKARGKSIAGLLASHESTFTNKVQSDYKLIADHKPGKASAVIKFNNNTYFTMCGSIITKQKQPPHSKLPVIAMRPYLVGIPYYKEKAMQIIDMAQQRLFEFDSLLTLKLFYKEIKVLKGE